MIAPHEHKEARLLRQGLKPIGMGLSGGQAYFADMAVTDGKIMSAEYPAPQGWIKYYFQPGLAEQVGRLHWQMCRPPRERDHRAVGLLLGYSLEDTAQFECVGQLRYNQ